MAIFPNDVSWLRGLRELHLLTQDIVFLCGIGDIESEVSGVIGFKGDESGGGNCELIEVLEQFVNLRVLFSHLVELLRCNEATTGSQGLDEVSVVEGINYVSYLGSAILLGNHAINLFTLLL